MDNLDIGIAGALVFLILGFIFSLFKTFLVFAVTYYASKAAAPFAATQLGITEKIEVSAKLYAVAFLTAWLFVAPLTLELINQLPFIGRTSINDYFNIISFGDLYLIGLTLFTFKSDLSKVALKPFRKTITAVIIFFTINLILNIVIATLSRTIYTGELYTISYFVVKPIVFGLITIRFIKKNYNN